MGLPWFPFNIKDFLANTKRLNTEAKGAYLCLMLDYYEQESGPPDDDEILASICELPIEAWQRHRKVISPLFEIRDGKWFHERIERELLEAKHKQATAKAKATAAGNARWAKSRTSATESRTDAPKTAQAEPQAMLGASLGDAHLTLTDTLSLGVALDQGEGKGTEPAEEPAFTPLDPNYQPPEAVMAECLTKADPSSVHLELQKFKFHQRENGGLSQDWDASFQKWFARFLEHQVARKPRTKARVEVNTTTTEEPKINWRWHLQRWLANESTWSRRTAGPEPGQPGCRVPREAFEAMGIDPATGRISTKETT